MGKPNGTGTASQTGVYAATLGVGIIGGSFLVTRLTTHQVEIGLIPIGSTGLICGSSIRSCTLTTSLDRSGESARRQHGHCCGA